jgi:hypothetical protein
MRTRAIESRSNFVFGRALGRILLGAAFFSASAIGQSFGPNVIVFNPSMSTSQIQTTVDAIATQQASNQFGVQRYALLFEPGSYGSASTPLTFQVGYYTEVAGLGASPSDVTINGTIDVYNQCFGGDTDCIALDNFWRSLSNLTISVTGGSGCFAETNFWAVSQASPLRRVNINGNLSLMDYCNGSPDYASGGFIADSQFQGGTIINGSQQQFYVRNSNIDGWSNAVWNQVFSGVLGAPAQSYPTPPYTTLTSTPVSREKPFLYMDSEGKYNVFAPAVQRNSTGTTWSGGTTAGQALPISRFFIASPTTPILEINLALALGKDLILTPGVYSLKAPIAVLYPDTIVLGLGFPTLVPQTGQEAISVLDVGGVQIAGLIIDAGPVNSPVLLKMGIGLLGLPLPPGGFLSHASNPSSINDVFFRIGGATAGSATTSLEVNSADVIVDDIWAWRADHGTGAGWTLNPAAHGLVVNGDRATALGLFVEHYQKEQVLWNGNGGETIFYQSELPYDPPSQSAWMDGTANGYPSYVVTNLANTHQAYGLGIYSNFNQGINIIEDNAMTVPDTSGVAVNDLCTVFLSGNGQITHVINGVGATVSSSNVGPSTVINNP